MMLKKHGSKYKASMQLEQKLHHLFLDGDDIEEVKSRLSPRELGALEAGLPVTLPSPVVNLLLDYDWEQS